MFLKQLNFPSINPLTPVPPVTARDEPWSFFHFWRHHFWPNWHHLYSTSAEGKDLSNMIPRSEWSAWWSLRYVQKCSKSWVKNSEQNLLPLHLAAHGKNCPPRWSFLRSFLTASKPSRRSITAAQRKEKKKKERGKKFKNRKAVTLVT